MMLSSSTEVEPFQGELLRQEGSYDGEIVVVLQRHDWPQSSLIAPALLA